MTCNEAALAALAKATTIKGYLQAHHAKLHAERIGNLEAMSAPSFVIEREQQLLDAALDGELNISDKCDCLAHTFVAVDWARGNGGKPFATFTTDNGDTVRYFPLAKHGRFLTS